MQKSLIFITLILIGAVTSAEIVAGDFTKCASDAQKAIKLAEQFAKDKESNDIAGLINDAALAIDLGIRISQDCRFFSDIKEELSGCAESIKLLMTTTAEIKQTFTFSNSMEAVEKLVVVATQIQSECPNSKEELAELITKKRDSSIRNLEAGSIPTWTPTYPFNITQCLQATTDLSSHFGDLWYAINAGQSTGNIISDVSVIVVAIEPLLRTCGEGKVADFLAKELPETCLVSITDISQTFVDIYEHRENTVYILTALAQVYTNFVKLRDSCPFLKVLPDLPPYDFENHQRIVREVEVLQQTTPATVEGESKKLFQFNVTTCIKESEKLSKEIDVFRVLYMQEEKDVSKMIESLVRAKEQLHVFFLKCGMESMEQKLEELIPTHCLDTTKELYRLLLETFSGDYILAEVIDVLPRVYLQVVEINSNCPKAKLPKGFLPK